MYEVMRAMLFLSMQSKSNQPEMIKKHLQLLLIVLTVTLISYSCSSHKLIKTEQDGIPNHPRIILLAGDEKELLKRIAESNDLSKINTLVISIADGYLNSESIKRKIIGKRLLQVSHSYLKRILFLSYSFRLTNDEKYLRQAEKEMLAASSFSDWNPSHFLDVAEMTTALAIGYDWLYNDLDKNSRQIVKDAIVNKGLLPSMENDQWWLKATNNWNQICNAGMVLGALAVYEDEPELAAEIIKRAETSIQLPLKEYEPDGAYPEGPGYWGYGTMFNVMLFDAIGKIPRLAQGFEVSEGFLKSGEYILHICGPKGYFNYSDCSTNCGFLPVITWFSAKLDNNNLLWNQRKHFDKLINRQSSMNYQGIDFSFLPFLLIWGSKLSSFYTDEPLLNSWIAEGVNPLGIHRTSWKDDAIFIAIKGGSPSLSHGHMDIGSFVMDANGVRWAIDLGAHNYHSLESKGINIWKVGQKSQRWDVFRYTNFSHNTLTVNNQLQQVDGEAKIIKSSSDENFRYTVVDISSCYKNLLQSAVRGIAIAEEKYVIIRDEVVNVNNTNTLRWSMVTHENIKITDHNSAVIRKGNESLKFQVVSPINVEIKTYSTDPPNDFEDKNPGTKMIGFEIDLKPNQQVEMVVLLVPEGTDIPNEINLDKINDW